MRHILIIGIGPGDPGQITLEAIEALNRADVVFLPDKGAEKAGLRQQRLDICARFIKGRKPRLVTYATPARDRNPADYAATVEGWHAAIAAAHQRLISEELGEAETGAFLVWGDPALYDSALRILENIHANDAALFDYEAIAGVSSAQALAARHRIALNRIGESVLFTTGRRLREKFPDADSIVVVLDDGSALDSIADGDIEIYWGANIGTPNEALISGRLAEVRAEIRAARESAKRAAGWVMDVYLLRRPRG